MVENCRLGLICNELFLEYFVGKQRGFDLIQ